MGQRRMCCAAPYSRVKSGNQHTAGPLTAWSKRDPHSVCQLVDADLHPPARIVVEDDVLRRRCALRAKTGATCEGLTSAISAADSRNCQKAAMQQIWAISTDTGACCPCDQDSLLLACKLLCLML